VNVFIGIFLILKVNVKGDMFQKVMDLSSALVAGTA
jgi:hypothetical protein